MTASNNDGGFSRLGTDPTLSGLRDGTDHPHSALFHALNMASKGSYAILDGNNFDITQSDSSGNTQFAVANGQIFRDGKLMPTVTGDNFTQGTPSTFDEPTSSGSAYYLLVVTSGNALAIRDNGNRDTKDVVPNLSSGDIPIAVIRLSYGETTTLRFIQFLTTDKTENSLSIGQGTPTVYSEQMSITSDGTHVTFTGASNTDIKFTPAGMGKIDITTGDVIVSNGNFETPNGYSETTIVRGIIDGGGAGLDAGTPVYPTGFSSGKITVEKADATKSANKSPAIGLVYSTISAGGNGKVIVNGLSGDISATLFDAGSYSEGDIIYLSANIGKMTNVRPTATTDIVQNIGRMIHLSSFTAGSSGTAKILVQGSGRENNVTNDGFVTTNASSITNGRQINAGNDISIIDNGAGSTVDIASISTLDSVTTRGNNTTNSIIVGDVTVDSDLKLSVSSNDVIIENTFLDKDIFLKGNFGGTPTNIAQVDVSAKALIVPDKIYANSMQLGYGTGPAKLQVYNAGDDLEIYAAGTTGGNVKIIDITAGTDGAEANRIVDISGNLTVSKNLTVDTDTLYVNSTNQRVGIETNAPDHELHIVGTTETGGFITGLTEKVAAPSPLDSYDIQVSDHTIFAALDPIGNNLTLNLPQGDTTQIGLEYRIIITTSGTGSLNLDVQSGDSLYDSTLTPLTTPYQLAGSGSPPYSAGDVLIILQKSGTEWVLFKTN